MDVIQAFKTDDGKIFEEREDAISHERKLSITETIRLFISNTTDMPLKENQELSQIIFMERDYLIDVLQGNMMKK